MVRVRVSFSTGRRERVHIILVPHNAGLAARRVMQRILIPARMIVAPTLLTSYRIVKNVIVTLDRALRIMNAYLGVRVSDVIPALLVVEHTKRVIRLRVCVILSACVIL